MHIYTIAFPSPLQHPQVWPPSSASALSMQAPCPSALPPRRSRGCCSSVRALFTFCPSSSRSKLFNSLCWTRLSSFSASRVHRVRPTSLLLISVSHKASLRRESFSSSQIHRSPWRPVSREPSLLFLLSASFFFFFFLSVVPFVRHPSVSLSLSLSLFLSVLLHFFGTAIPL